MANYKQRPFNIISLGGITIQLDKSFTIKSLNEPVANSNAPDSFRDISNVTYVVPSGKTFHMVGVRIIIGQATGGSLVIYQGDTEDAITTQKISVTLPSSIGVFEYSILPTFAAGKYITIDPSGTVIENIECLGYETDD